MFDVMVDEELVQGEMEKKNKKRQERQDTYVVMQFKRGA